MAAAVKCGDGKRSKVEVRWDIGISLRDGVRLSATLYLPRTQAKPCPCIFALTPYTTPRNHPRASYFASRGYPFLVVDTRGRGNSEGSFRPFIQEANDGYDVVEWIAAQTFCNGKVAMFSGSYEGYAQWATASKTPPHLLTIVPGMAAAPGIDFPTLHNIGRPYIMQWLLLVAGRTSQERIFDDHEFWQRKFGDWYESGLPFRELDNTIGYPSATFQEWLAHPSQDSYWDAFRPSAAEYANLNIPILTLTGAYDGNQQGALHYYREHLRNSSVDGTSKHYLVIGPWDHRGTLEPKSTIAGLEVGPAALIDVLQLHADWYAWTMAGGVKPAFLKKNVMYYVTAAEEWRSADSLESITVGSKELFLRSHGTASNIFGSGELSEECARGSGDTYVYDPRDIEVTDVEIGQSDPYLIRGTFLTNNLTDQSVLYAMDGRQLVYHSAPLERDVEVSGFFRLSVWISMDQPDTDFRAAVYEIGTGGGSLLLAVDTLRARYRESVREARLVMTIDALRYDFNHFTFVSRLVRRGCRLRLVIGPINSMYTEKNYNTGGRVSMESVKDARRVTVRLLHDDAHPSALYVPLGQRET